MNIEILPMQSIHIADIYKIETECFSDPWNEESFHYRLSSDTSFFLTALCDGEVAGYIGIIEVCETCEIANVAVSNRFRRLGIAKKLLATALKGAKERKRETAILEVRPSNTAAISLYEQFGFSVCTVRKNYYSHPTEDALIMIKSLDNGEEK